MENFQFRAQARRAVAGFFVVLLLAMAPAHAQRQWTKIDIPGARCGDGSQYQVLLSPGDPRKIAFELMGGGACWSFATCFGPTPLAWLHRIPNVYEKDGFVSDDPARSPAADYTMIYFPYCTGDAHLGDHVATYAGFAKVHHQGKRNFELAIENLQQTRQVNFKQADRVILYGQSAGALGAFFHIFTLKPYFEHATSKVLLADAPGLHFGDGLWKKFSPELLRDFEAGFKRAGFSLDRSHGNIAGLIPAVCRLFSDWNVGVLQGSRDVVMSRVFGELSPDEHEQMIYGPGGLYQLTLDPHDRCAAWVPSTATHMFLELDSTAKMTTADGKSAMDFAFDTVAGTGGQNHR
ncbi:MAG: hypothetical protein HY074_09425 [Deltaproteobacteria bacterium]|nr:hypothetical protein [Deltaproteobacteria bacterium]